VLTEVEPFYGWLDYYSAERDQRSPFHGVEPSLFEYNRAIYNMPAHPLWDDIESDGLLVKILFAHYKAGFAIVELMGEWNDLHQNDFKLLCENCLTYLVDNGINRIILIAENVFNVWPGTDDYYEAFNEELEDGWLFLLRPRDHVRAEFQKYRLAPYLYWNDAIDALHWRKTKPWDLYRAVYEHIEGEPPPLPEPTKRLKGA